MLKTISEDLRSRFDRAAARRRYTRLQDTLNETFDDLYVADGHDESAALLEFAANVTERLAEEHTAAWGRGEDADGRPMADALLSRAALLRQVAATERAVVGSIIWPNDRTPPAREHAAEVRAWAELAHTSEPRDRAIWLRRLHDLAARHVGARAADVLTVLAEVEEHRAAGVVGRPSRPRYVLPRLTVAAALAFVALVVFAPGLDGLGRLVLVVALLGTAYGALCVYVGLRGRSLEVRR